MAKQHRRSSYIAIPGPIQLERAAAVIWGYDQSEKMCCKIEVSGAGIAVYEGERGRRLVADVSWEELVKRLR